MKDKILNVLSWSIIALLIAIVSLTVVLTIVMIALENLKLFLFLIGLSAFAMSAGWAAVYRINKT